MYKEKEKRDFHHIFVESHVTRDFHFAGRKAPEHLELLLNGNCAVMRVFLEKLWYEIYNASRYVESPVTVKRIVYRFLKFSNYFKLNSADKDRAFKVLRLMLEFLMRGIVLKTGRKRIAPLSREEINSLNMVLSQNADLNTTCVCVQDLVIRRCKVDTSLDEVPLEIWSKVTRWEDYDDDDEPIGNDYLRKEKKMSKETKMEELLNVNIAAFQNASSIMACEQVIKKITEVIRPHLPMMMRGYLDVPGMDVAIVNGVIIALEKLRPDWVRNNEKAIKIMRTAAYHRALVSGGVDQMVSNLLNAFDPLLEHLETLAEPNEAPKKKK